MQGGLGKRGAFFANNTNRPKAANAYQHDGMLNGDVFVAKCNIGDNEYDDVYDNDNCDYDKCLMSDSVYGDSEFIVPVFVNGINCKALRDSGNFGLVIVDESLVPKDDINYRKTVDCTGAFDGGRSKSIPTAKIKLSSPWFNTSGNIHITAAVTKLPQGLSCILGNSFYKNHPHVSDIIHVTKSRKMQTAKPNMTLDTPGQGGDKGDLLARQPTDKINSPDHVDTDTPACSAQSLTADSDKRPTGGRQPATPIERPTQAVSGGSSGDSSVPCNHSIIDSPSSGHMIAERAGGDESTGVDADLTQTPQAR